MHQLDLAAPGALERHARVDPHVVHGFVRVVGPLLPGRRQRDEKARVEAPAAAWLRDPVAVVGEGAGRDIEALLLEERQERAGPCAHERFGACRRDRIPARIARKQHARLLEALAHRRDVIGDRALRKAEALVRLRLAQADDPRRACIRSVERAARKHVRAAEERRALRPLQHQRLEAARTRTQQDERGRGARLDRRNRHAVRPARSLSFCALIIARMPSQSASESLSSWVK